MAFRKYYCDTFQAEIYIVNGVQVLLDCHESSAEKTINITKKETFVKENYSLLKKRVTVYTELSIEKRVSLIPEFKEFKYLKKREKVSSYPLLEAFTLN